MHFKLFLVAFLAVFSYGSCVDLDVGVDSLFERSIIEDFQQVIEQLKNAVANAIAEVKLIVGKLYEQLSAEVKELLEKAIADLNAVLAQVKEGLEQAKEAALALGEVARKCVLEQEDRVVALAQNTNAAVQECRQTFLDGARDVANEVLADVQSLREKATELKNKFNDCGNIFCKAGVLNDIKELVTSVPDQVRENLALVGEFIQTAQPVLQACVQKTMDNYQQEMTAVASDIQKCLAA